MSKKEVKGLLKDTVIIFVITLVAGVLLGVVYELTKEPIMQQEIAAKASACNEVFYEADHQGNMQSVATLTFDEVTLNAASMKEILKSAGYEKDEISEVYQAADESGNLYGYVIGVISHEGYGGNISFYMGVTIDGTIKGVSLLSISETPGLGMRAQEVLVPQFANVKADNFTVTKSGATTDSEIDAITSATITSNALTRGVNAGLICFGELTKGGNQE